MAAPQEQIAQRIAELQAQTEPLSPGQEETLAELKAALRTPPHTKATTRAASSKSKGKD